MSRVARKPNERACGRCPGSSRHKTTCRPPLLDGRRGRRSTTDPRTPLGIRRVAGKRPSDDEQRLRQDLRSGTIAGVVGGAVRVFVVWLAEHGHSLSDIVG